MSRIWIFGSLLLMVLVLGIGAVVWTRMPDVSPALPIAVPKTPDSSSVLIQAQDIPGAASEFTFTAMIPNTWKAEAIASVDAISLYDPTSPGNNTLEKSQIFIRSFTASDFLTLSTVTIYSRTPLTVAGRPAVRYDIQKKPTVADFRGQPGWRSRRHIVTDIRVSDRNPSVFYVIGRRPDLDEAIYQEFLASLHVSAETISLVEPVAEFKARITKKPFGIFITPDASPIEPERFSGYHTGVDVEYDDVADEVPVLAVADGEVVLAQRAGGYGGVIVMRHTIQGEPYVAVLGHLDPGALPGVGSKLTAGAVIGRLGEGGTSETDGERKHLHFAMMKDSGRIDLRGYVATKEELINWIDPLKFFG